MARLLGTWVLRYTAIISFYKINLFVNRILGNNKEVWVTQLVRFLSVNKRTGLKFRLHLKKKKKKKINQSVFWSDS